MSSNNQKLICFYLPQYHPIPENNEWWGPGFTEWTNVAVTKPRFQGHHQPQIPGDLGFYDLRLEHTRIQQAELAKQYGIYGFCYYHYWFNGKRLLHKPLDEVLASKRPDFPFCVCWANENWTRAWDGLDRQVLISQSYTDDDNLEHIKWLMGVFTDQRYILINGKPLLLIYRLDNIPNVQSMITLWQKVAVEYGFKGIYLCAVKTGFVSMTDSEIINCGFSAVVDFQPNRGDFPPATGIKARAYKMLRSFLPNSIYQKIKLSVTANNIINYERMIEGLIARKWPADYRKFPCAFPSWDNSPRRKSATIIQNEDTKLFSTFVADCISKVKLYPKDEQFVFINAWNEWAEGCHLEPDRKNGHLFLEAVKSANKEGVE